MGRHPISIEQRTIFSVSKAALDFSTVNQALMININNAIRIEGKLDYGLFVDAVNELRSHHEILRSVFVLDGGELYLESLDTYPYELELHNVSSGLMRQRLIAAREIYTDIIHEKFDIRTVPPNRFFLIKLAENDHLMGISISHSISDGWSLSILIEEIVAYIISRGHSVNSNPVQYGDYIDEQRLSYPDGIHFTGSRDYWMQQFDLINTHRFNELPQAEGPEADPPRPFSITIKGRRRKALNQAAKSAHTSVFTVILAAIHLALADLHGTEMTEVTICSSNRDNQRYQKTPGLFIRLLPNVLIHHASDTVGSLLGRLAKTISENLKHQKEIDEVFRLNQAGPLRNPLLSYQSYSGVPIEGERKYFNLTLSNFYVEDVRPLADGWGIAAFEDREQIKLTSRWDPRIVDEAYIRSFYVALEENLSILAPEDNFVP